MKTALIAIALLSGTAALAQDEVPPPADYPIAAPATAPDPLTPDTSMTPVMAVASTGQTALPSNAAPEQDARGIAVISDPATVPAGYNGTPTPLNGTGGPLLDATGEPAAMPDASYPACTRAVTDNCLQTYERGRQR